MSDSQSSVPPTWAPPAPPSPDAPHAPHGAAVSSAGLVDAGAASAAAPSRRGRRAGAVVGAVALVAAGGFAVVQVTGGDESGGAASPSEVGTQFVAALEAEDVLGVIDLLLPAERDALRDPLTTSFDHLVRLGVLADDARLDGLNGVDIELDGVSIREQPTNAADITNLFLSGSGSVSVDGDAVPIGDLLLDHAFGGERPDLDVEPESEDFDDVPLTVVERDGRWYLSAFYTAAEQARVESGGDIPAEGVAPTGGDTPEGALDAVLDAAEDLDVEALIAALDPAEAEALQRYAPLFLDELDDPAADTGFELSITEREYRVEGEGSRRWVSIEALRVELSDPSDRTGLGTISFELDGDCMTVVILGERTESCAGDVDIDAALEESGFDLGPAMGDLVEEVTQAFEDFDPRGIAVHEVGGRWYLAPLRTGFDAADDVLSALERDELEGIIEATGPAIDEFFGMFLGFDPLDI